MPSFREEKHELVLKEVSTMAKHFQHYNEGEIALFQGGLEKMSEVYAFLSGKALGASTRPEVSGTFKEIAAVLKTSAHLPPTMASNIDEVVEYIQESLNDLRHASKNPPHADGSPPLTVEKIDVGGEPKPLKYLGKA